MIRTVIIIIISIIICITNNNRNINVIAFSILRQQQSKYGHKVENGIFKNSISYNSNNNNKFGDRRQQLIIKNEDNNNNNNLVVLYGIPKMFRWLTDQYPDVLNKQLTDVGIRDDIIVDNFYLDMNGIIHPCTHGNSKDTGEFIALDETAMFKRIFLYVDRLFKLVRPTKVLYLAVDGVAPRAKMNQQRSRRFRAAKEVEQQQIEQVAQQQYSTTNYNSNTNSFTNTNTNQKEQDQNEQDQRKRFDSNCITPGTDFMNKLCIALQRWVDYKINTDPFWGGIDSTCTIIINGPDIPGEGEHKVMDFIRTSRTAVLSNTASTIEQHYWQPNYVHVLYGLDADLIMLGLVTHEPNFLLLREKMSVVMAGRQRNNNNNNRRRGGYNNNQQQQRKKKDMLEYDKNDFEVLELSLLRKMLAIQFRRFADDSSSSNTNTDDNNKKSQLLRHESYNLDRIVDDFVFMCMLVGNDFLPHIPHLEIDSGALSLMMSTYTDLLGEWGGYLTNKECINPSRFEQFIYEISFHYEQDYFKRRGYDENEIGWQLPYNEQTENDTKLDSYGTYYSGASTPLIAQLANKKTKSSTSTSVQIDENGNIIDPNEPVEELVPMIATANREFRRKYPINNYSRSYRDFYYQYKLNWLVQDRSRTLYRRRKHVRDYIEGLHWNLNYYHNGCSSWDWYFPYLYAPLGTDMVNLHEFYETTTGNDKDGKTSNKNNYCTMEFDLGQPFPSLAQLLAVLPPQSAELLPKPLAELMIHPSSPIKQFYPYEYSTDPNGKRQSWEALVLIPFINSDLLLTTVQQILDRDEQLVQAKIEQHKQQQQDTDQGTTEHIDPDMIVGLLTPSERRRNILGTVHEFVPPKQLSLTTTTTRSSSTSTSTLPTATGAVVLEKTTTRRTGTTKKKTGTVSSIGSKTKPPTIQTSTTSTTSTKKVVKKKKKKSASSE